MQNEIAETVNAATTHFEALEKLLVDYARQGGSNSISMWDLRDAFSAIIPTSDPYFTYRFSVFARTCIDLDARAHRRIWETVDAVPDNVSPQSLEEDEPIVLSAGSAADNLRAPEPVLFHARPVFIDALAKDPFNDEALEVAANCPVEDGQPLKEISPTPPSCRETQARSGVQKALAKQDTPEVPEGLPGGQDHPVKHEGDTPLASVKEVRGTATTNTASQVYGEEEAMPHLPPRPLNVVPSALLQTASAPRHRPQLPTGPPQSTSRGKQRQTCPSPDETTNERAIQLALQKLLVSAGAKPTKQLAFQAPRNDLEGRKFLTLAREISDIKNEYKEEIKRSCSLFEESQNKPAQYPKSQIKDLLEYNYVDLEKLYVKVYSKPSSSRTIKVNKADDLEFVEKVKGLPIRDKVHWQHLIRIIEHAYKAAFPPATKAVGTYFNYILELVADPSLGVHWEDVRNYDAALRHQFAQRPWISFGDWTNPELDSIKS
ncbi:uncharacterized protein MELLADRAFT_84603 [Melampsora larici-populina 98AG31]|uniref:Uncharacterized protein n=1 Tax=Melampsora larici-populina (strain 98AG31 / pathotype 3-4-7) TaxID=747676 RepID=F4RG95_MELLP|nr:uncharacterized protein MELLADRAFT_84603 [Melampsora larici-populina 98AG31]EGG08707.1 hypothetical protein MELLADRAFT_84603 [Melampsora larici-populina 98AG31]